MQNLKQRIESQEIYQSIRNFLPTDHSNAQQAHYYLEYVVDHFSDNSRVLDLGCGAGDSIDQFRKLSVDTIWHGVDIENSPEVKRRVRTNTSILSFNGVDLPYPDNYFDLIFCQQVLEHARHPDALISDAYRVLKPTGVFIGSVSYLEPYHSYSIFNFTPYGIVRVFGDAGFELKEIRPASDASSVINRQLFNRSKLVSLIWKYNFLHSIIGVVGRVFGLGHQERNFLKIQFSGHLVFFARR
ncbi:MAG: class I SAM-dependent methyltransferase [Candidatus Electrothrix sp. AR4]|nr:class I SAM-dependent methyltransferase [Candidatus Electrothrix sp. AR4]